MLQEVLEDHDFPQVSSARGLVNMSGTESVIDWKFSQVEYICLHVKMEGSTAVSPLPWWQKLELNKYLRNQARD
jgi:hypothetical protein